MGALESPSRAHKGKVKGSLHNIWSWLKQKTSAWWLLVGLLTVVLWEKVRGWFVRDRFAEWVEKDAEANDEIAGIELDREKTQQELEQEHKQKQASRLNKLQDELDKLKLQRMKTIPDVKVDKELLKGLDDEDWTI